MRHAAILVLVTVGCVGCGLKAKPSTMAPSVSSIEKAEEVTLEKFNQIEKGMAFSQVIEIVGFKPYKSFREPDEFHTEMAFWGNDKVAIICMFQNGVVISMVKRGLD